MLERIVTPNATHHAFRSDAIDLLNKHAGNLDASETLALAAHLVGQILAMQDQRTMTSNRAMEIVARNIEIGNAEAVASLMESKGNG